MVRSPSLAPVRLLRLHQQLNQRGKSHRRKRRTRLQRAEQAGKALLGDDLAGELNVGPDRLSGLGRDLRIRIGLSNLDADKERNLQLLKERGWFDMPLVYNNNRRAILAMAKGPPGDRAFADAFEAWKQ
jgi:hypothetical protein